MRNEETPRPDDGALSTEDLAGTQQVTDDEAPGFAEAPPAYPGEATTAGRTGKKTPAGRTDRKTPAGHPPRDAGKPSRRTSRNHCWVSNRRSSGPGGRRSRASSSTTPRTPSTRPTNWSPRRCRHLPRPSRRTSATLRPSGTGVRRWRPRICASRSSSTARSSTACSAPDRHPPPAAYDGARLPGTPAASRGRRRSCGREPPPARAVGSELPAAAQGVTSAPPAPEADVPGTPAASVRADTGRMRRRGPPLPATSVPGRRRTAGRWWR